MNVKHFRLLIISLLLGYNLLLTPELVAQSDVQKDFADKIGVSQLIYHGFNYWRIGYKTKGHPFFGTDAMQPATIYYRNARYQNLPVLFDIHQGLVVIYDYYKQMQIALVTEKIDSIEIGPAFFCKVNTSLVGQSPPDLMERVQKGNRSLYARHYKVLQTPKRAEDTNPPSFIERIDWYVQHADDWIKIDSEKKLLALDEKRKDEIKQLIKSNKASLKHNPRETIGMVVHYLNTKN